MDGTPLVYEPLDGGRGPQAVDDVAVLQGDVAPHAAPPQDEGGVCRVDVADAAALHVVHLDGSEDAAMQDGEDDVAPPCHETGGVASDEAECLVLALGETGEHVLRCGAEHQAASVRADHGGACRVLLRRNEGEDVRRSGQALHQAFFFRTIHSGSPLFGGITAKHRDSMTPACRWRGAQARDTILDLLFLSECYYRENMFVCKENFAWRLFFFFAAAGIWV